MTTTHKHECEHLLSTHCTRGAGMPKRQRCAHCKGRIHVYAGLWGVFAWTAENHYPLANAIETFTSKAYADRIADAGDNTVVRWISA